MATVMNYKDEDIERFEENNSQNNGELLKEKQNNANAYETLHKSSKKATSPNSQNISELVVKEEKFELCVKNSSSININTQDDISGMTLESKNNREDVAKTELSNCQPTGQLVHPPGQTTESSNGFRKNLIEKKDSNLNYNGYQNNSSDQTIPLCEQEGQVKMMKLAGLTVIMHRKKGEIIYRLADNMSVSSLSDAQREALLKEIKTLHDSNAIVTQSMPQHTQDQGISTTSSQSTINATTSRLPTSTSLPEHPSVTIHNTSTKVQSSLASASQLTRSSSFPISTSTSSNKSINSTAALNTQTASKQLYIPLTSRPPLVVAEIHSAVSDRSQSTTPSNMTSQTLYPSSPLEDSFYSDGSSRSTRSTTPTTRPIVQYYSAPTPLHRPSTSHGFKRSFQSTGLQRTAEEINHNSDIVQRFEAATKADQMAVLQPDYKTPFRSLKDAVARLLPYHIFEYPEEDMKGNNQTSDLDATKNALRLYKRRKMIFDKYNDLLKKEAEKSCSTAYTNLCERLIVDDVKTEIMTLKENCRQLSEQIKSRSQLSVLKQHQQQLQLQQLQPQPPSTQQPKQPELPQRQN
ncbi:unnamed protein product [Rhizophagus irregularis]|nr:unnamed protein product [Rhizophagus irregularis]